jgi:hypothetical protein
MQVSREPSRLVTYIISQQGACQSVGNYVATVAAQINAIRSADRIDEARIGALIPEHPASRGYGIIPIIRRYIVYKKIYTAIR